MSLNCSKPPKGAISSSVTTFLPLSLLRPRQASYSGLLAVLQYTKDHPTHLNSSYFAISSAWKAPPLKIHRIHSLPLFRPLLKCPVFREVLPNLCKKASPITFYLLCFTWAFFIVLIITWHVCFLFKNCFSLSIRIRILLFCSQWNPQHLKFNKHVNKRMNGRGKVSVFKQGMKTLT